MLITCFKNEDAEIKHPSFLHLVNFRIFSIAYLHLFLISSEMTEQNDARNFKEKTISKAFGLRNRCLSFLLLFIPNYESSAILDFLKD